MSSSFRARFEYFLELPVEIRVKIYDLVLCSPRGVAPEYVRSDEQEKVDLGLLRVNKLVALEATKQFYSFNTFHFHSTARMILDRNRWRRKSEARDWCKKIGRNAHLVRHIEYRIYPFDRPDLTEFQVDLESICSLVPNIQTLRVMYDPNGGILKAPSFLEERKTVMHYVIQDTLRILQELFGDEKKAQVVPMTGMPPVWDR